jgi:glycosyltransferase involved in cell wall biosynthesis
LPATNESEFDVKVAIGIPTYNRRYLVETHAQSLCSAWLPDKTEIIVIDDCSTEFDTAYLKSIYPGSADVRRRSEHSGGADFAARDVMVKLVETGADVLLLLDSDMIVTSDFLSVGLKLLPDCRGVLSLFNTPSHPAVGHRDGFVLKRTIGAAATLWRRDLALEMLDHVGPGSLFDWRFSEYLLNAGYEICVTKDSRVQHAGFAEGEHSRFDGKGDYGLGFFDADVRNLYRMTEIVLHQIQSMAADGEKKRGAIRDDIESLRKSLADNAAALEGSHNTLSRRTRRIETMLGLTLLHRIERFIRRLRS